MKIVACSLQIDTTELENSSNEPVTFPCSHVVDLLGKKQILRSNTVRQVRLDFALQRWDVMAIHSCYLGRPGRMEERIRKDSVWAENPTLWYKKAFRLPGSPCMFSKFGFPSSLNLWITFTFTVSKWHLSSLSGVQFPLYSKDFCFSFCLCASPDLHLSNAKAKTSLQCNLQLRL